MGPPIRLRGLEPLGHHFFTVVGLATLGIGAWVLRYAFTQPTGLDRSALWAALIFIGIGIAAAVARIGLRRRWACDYVEFDQVDGCCRLIWNDGLYAEMPRGTIRELGISRVSAMRPAAKGTTWTWYEVSTPGLLFPLYVTKLECDARSWAHSFAARTGATVQTEICARMWPEQIAHIERLVEAHAQAKTLDAALGTGGIPRVGSWGNLGDARRQRLLDEARARHSGPT